MVDETKLKPYLSLKNQSSKGLKMDIWLCINKYNLY